MEETHEIIVLGAVLILVLVVGVIALSWYVHYTTYKPVGSTAPCDNYVQITSKYKSLDNNGITHYNLVLSTGKIVEISGWINDASNEIFWERAELNTTGSLRVDTMLGSYKFIAFEPQNITRSSEGLNFCKVLP